MMAEFDTYYGHTQFSEFICYSSRLQKVSFLPQQETNPLPPTLHPLVFFTAATPSPSLSLLGKQSPSAPLLQPTLPSDRSSSLCLPGWLPVT